MTSLELVDFINSIRGPSESQLRHDHFMVKVSTVLKTAAPNFLGTATYKNNCGAEQTRNIYNLPRKQTLQMAPSYSLELQEAVLDAWMEAEQSLCPLPSIQRRKHLLKRAHRYIVIRNSVVFTEPLRIIH